MHSLSIEERKSFTATEIKEVAAFSDKEVKLVAKNDSTIIITGDGLKINGFSKDNGSFSLTGNVRSVRYGASSESLFKRIFR
ncbi:MAG: hypothetical protein J5762_02875 [Clostridia bacterium]|nr:hypothetical protein [Clostridia bacterium]